MSHTVTLESRTRVRSWLAILGLCVHLTDLVLVVLGGSERLPAYCSVAAVALTLAAPYLPNWRSKGGLAASAIYPALASGLLGTLAMEML